MAVCLCEQLVLLAPQGPGTQLLPQLSLKGEAAGQEALPENKTICLSLKVSSRALTPARWGLLFGATSIFVHLVQLQEHERDPPVRLLAVNSTAF